MAIQTQKKKAGSKSAFRAGAIALAFLIIGYQAALFVHRAAVLHIQAARDNPDTVYVVDEALAARVLGARDGGGGSAGFAGSSRASGSGYPGASCGGSPSGASPGGSSSCDSSQGGSSGVVIVRREAAHPAAVAAVRAERRRVESFRFDPNTVSLEDLVKLGFSEKQAQSIVNYREKGGRFRRKSDFAKSFVVADSVYKRLEPYIYIPKIDINKADSAAFDSLPGIGPYFAAKMVSYRSELGGYSCKEQLMDIYNFDKAKYDGLSDLVVCGPGARPFRLWTLPADSLRLHPCIRSRQVARSIVLYRDNTPRDGWTVDGLRSAGVLDSLAAARLARCLLAEP